MIRTIALAAAGCFVAVPALAQSAIALEAGHGSGDTHLLRAAAQWERPRKWFAGRPWHVSYLWEASFGGWTGGHGKVYDFAFTPLFRLERSARSPYFEAAVGFHLLSDLDVGTGSEFSSRFQFGDHVGAGVRFGDEGRYDLGVKLQHLSNGGLRNPNPGINFLIVRLQARF